MIKVKKVLLIPLCLVLSGCIQEYKEVTLEYEPNALENYIVQNYPDCLNCSIMHDEDDPIPIKHRPELNHAYKMQVYDPNLDKVIERLNVSFVDTTAPQLVDASDVRIGLETYQVSGLTLSDNYDNPEELQLSIGHHDPYSVGEYYIDIIISDANDNKTLVKSIKATVTGEPLTSYIEFKWDELSVRPVLIDRDGVSNDLEELEGEFSEE